MTGTGYIRRIIYFTEYKENTQRENAGFARVERIGNWLNFTFSLKVPCVNGTWQAYGFLREEGALRLILLGELQLQGANWVLTGRTQADDINGSSYHAEAIDDYLVMDGENHYCSTNKMRSDIWRYEVERTEAEQIEPEISAAETAPPPEIDAPKPRVEVELKNQSHWGKKLIEELPKMYPFEDDEMEDCVRLEPKDFGSLPANDWPMAKNSFLLEGYYTYRHITLARKKKREDLRYYLGVPGVYHRRDCFLANMFGFPYFKGVKNKEPAMGDFGYWFKEIE